MKEKFLVIDGNSLVFRAFYGLPPLYSLDKEPCNAVYGFCKMLINVIQKTMPKYILVAFDAGKHTFRHDFYADYKGTRKPMPDELRAQLQPVKNLLNEMGIKTVEIPNIEADDIIGSTARKFDCEMILVSGDRDLLQLVDDRTTVLLTVKGISDIVEVDIPTLKEKYGIEPYQVIEMKSIMGDTSDNIPGVKGIGEKTALKLISEYQSLDGIFENIDKITGKPHNLLVENKETAYLSKRLATIKTDVDLEFEKEDCVYHFPFKRTVHQIMTNLGFKSILNRSELFERADIAQNVEKVNYILKEINTLEEFNELAETIRQRKIFSLNVSNLSINIGVEKTEYVISNFVVACPEFYTIIGDLFNDKDIEKIMFDVKWSKHFFKQFNIEINNYFDVSLAIYLVNESEGVLEFEKFMESKGLNKDYPACNLYALKEDLSETLKQREQWSLYQDMELKLVDVLFDMEKAGIKIDVDQIVNLSKKYTIELDELTKKIYNLVGEFNIKSPKQLQKILFEDLKLEYKGKKSTNVDVLEAIQDQHEIVGLILRYRKVSKLISTYLEGMLPYVDKSTSKIHTTFMQSFTTTGRLSSREPNLQNIPVRDDESKVLRSLFVSSFDNGSIMSADYNQIELRLMAILSKDSNLMNDFNNKIDVHSMTASKIFNINPEDVTPQERRVAKAVNFGIIYGISEYGLSKNINSSPKQAKEFIEKYFELYPDVKKYMNESIEYVKEKGYSKTLYNRIRHIPEINSTNYTVRTFGERVALNMPLQGTASDIIKLAMIKVYEAINNKNLKSKLILQIHDELIIDVYPGEEEICAQLLRENMKNIVEFSLPLEVEVNYGKNWLEAK